eukprot:Selendium_serpulae@DN3867_c0_g1_i2.p1
MNHYKLLSLLLGVVAVADADYRTSKNFIHSVEFTICGNDPTVDGKPIIGVALAETGEFTVELWNKIEAGETATETATFTNTVTVPGEVVVQAFQSTHRDAVALAAGGGIYLIGPAVGPAAPVLDCIYWGTPPAEGPAADCSLVDGDPTTGIVYSLAPTTPDAYLGEVKGDYTGAVFVDADEVTAGTAVCMATDPSARAAFVGSNTATAFVNEIVVGAGADGGFEIAMLGDAGPYTLYVGDGAAVFDGSHEFPAGTDSQWTLPFVTRDTLGDESTWTM